MELQPSLNFFTELLFIEISKIQITFTEKEEKKYFIKKILHFLLGYKCWDNNFITGVTIDFEVSYGN